MSGRTGDAPEENKRYKGVNAEGRVGLYGEQGKIALSVKSSRVQFEDGTLVMGLLLCLGAGTPIHRRMWWEVCSFVDAGRT